ncbi:RNA exonuclease 3 [Oleoguttula sp. CCFEE 5521]
MVFTPTNLFKGIQCPQSDDCKLTNCIFGHSPLKQERGNETATTNPSVTSPRETNGSAQLTSASNASNGVAAKRSKPTYQTIAEKPLSRAEKIKADLEATRLRKTARAESKPSQAPTTLTGSQASANDKPPSSLLREVSPPPRPTARTLAEPPSNTNSRKRSHEASEDEHPAKRIASVKTESLNPRMLANAPESHARRAVYLQLIHKDMVRLNAEVSKATTAVSGWEPDRMRLLVLDDSELIKFALDEEEKIAREHPKVYGNVIKNRIVAYHKMKPEPWLEIVLVSFGKDAPSPIAKVPTKALETGLTPSQEVEVATQFLLADQQSLKAHGYIPDPPTVEQAEAAAKAVEISKHYEECDRCGSRFQMFPDRNEEGILATNGPCKFHPMRKVYPTRTKIENYTGGKDPLHPCCNDAVGSPGCTEREDHIFKTDSPARLAAVLPFITTPENLSQARDKRGAVVKAVTFDCEMGYTSLGFEMVRLTAVTWPEGRDLLDILVRPLGTIIDLNSRFSGVWPEHFTKATPYETWLANPLPALDPTQTPSESKTLPVVDSPRKARELLCSFLTPTTPLIGHAIENDLNVTRLCHPTVIDTMLLYPHPRGLPFRFGLKMLSKKYLQRDIQTGGDRGHDSLEDAISTGDLVRVKVGLEWKRVRKLGWAFEDDEYGESRLVRPHEGNVFAAGLSVDADPKKLAGLDGTDESDDVALPGFASGMGGITVADITNMGLAINVVGS